MTTTKERVQAVKAWILAYFQGPLKDPDATMAFAENLANHLVKAEDAQVAELVIGVQNALSALGTGKCFVNKCEGCKSDVGMAIESLQIALRPFMVSPC